MSKFTLKMAKNTPKKHATAFCRVLVIFFRPFFQVLIFWFFLFLVCYWHLQRFRYTEKFSKIEKKKVKKTAHWPWRVAQKTPKMTKNDPFWTIFDDFGRFWGPRNLWFWQFWDFWDPSRKWPILSEFCPNFMILDDFGRFWVIFSFLERFWWKMAILEILGVRRWFSPEIDNFEAILLAESYFGCQFLYF